MIYWRQVPSWVFRAWPVIALTPAIAIHWLAYKNFPAHTTLVNKIAGMILQIVGGSLILYSINDNLGLFRHQSILTTVRLWFDSFPRARKVVSVGVIGAGSFAAAGSIAGSVSTEPNTLEERVNRLEIEVKSLRQEVAANAKVAQKGLQDAKAELGVQITNTNTQIANLSKKVEEAAVGGFKVQAFGVLLAIYGALTSVFA